MSLLDNAIHSIQIGLDNYKYDDHLVSSVRNIYAGILLLFKYKLFLMSGKETNAVLIKKDIIPTIDSQGMLVWKGVGDKTIDVAEIKKRFKSLEIPVDWTAFDRINKHRNEVEHYFSPLSEEQTTELLADCFILISKFLSENLDLDTKKILGDEAWLTLLHAHEVYEYEINKNDLAIELLIFHHEIIKEIFLDFSCIDCSSLLVQPTKLGEANEVIFCCAECESKYSYDEICNMGICDLYIGHFQTKATEATLPFSNCEICNQGLYLREYSVCTACGCIV